MVADMMVENNELKTQLIEKNMAEVYRENKMLKLEIKNMYLLLEENKDLKEQLQHFKSISYDERIKLVNQENERLQIRIGELLHQNDELKKKLNFYDITSLVNHNELERPSTITSSVGLIKDDF
jgi:aspartyl/asparaginyl-tRNA synthetase